LGNLTNKVKSDPSRKKKKGMWRGAK
jgi:hypothetical protein